MIDTFIYNSLIIETIAANQNGTSLDVALLVNQMVVALNTAHAQVLSIPVNAASTVNADSVSDDLADTINVCIYQHYSAIISAFRLSKQIHFNLSYS